MKRILILLMAGLFVLSFAGLALADVEQMKVYKEAFPGSKPKCIDCHTTALPKKDAEHALNDYGKKVTAIAEKPTAADYKKAGAIGESKK